MLTMILIMMTVTMIMMMMVMRRRRMIINRYFTSASVGNEMVGSLSISAWHLTPLNVDEFRSLLKC